MACIKQIYLHLGIEINGRISGKRFTGIYTQQYKWPWDCLIEPKTTGARKTLVYLMEVKHYIQNAISDMYIWNDCAKPSSQIAESIENK